VSTVTTDEGGELVRVDTEVEGDLGGEVAGFRILDLAGIDAELPIGGANREGSIQRLAHRLTAEVATGAAPLYAIVIKVAAVVLRGLVGFLASGGAGRGNALGGADAGRRVLRLHCGTAGLSAGAEVPAALFQERFRVLTRLVAALEGSDLGEIDAVVVAGSTEGAIRFQRIVAAVDIGVETGVESAL
jgi:hypothetical protein